MTDLEIKFPLHGVDRSQRPGAQQQDTTSDAVNMRPQNVITGSAQGGARAGTRKACEAQLGSEPILDLAQCVVDTRRVEYGIAAPPTVVSSTTGKSNGDAYNIRIDQGGNRYVCDGGKSIEVTNVDDVVIGTINLPCDDRDAIVRALAVDSGSRVFAGVSEGGDQSLARMWCYERDAYGGYRQLWELDAGGFVVQLDINAGRLYGLVNSPDTGRAYLRVWQFPDSASPRMDWEHSVAAPGTVFAIAPNGDIAVGAAQVAIRASVPTAPQSTQVQDEENADFHIAQLEDFRLRQFTDLDADKIVGQDGDDVAEWIDGFKFGHNVYSPVGITRASAVITACKLKTTGTLGARKGIRFDGLANFMSSYPNPSKSATGAGTQKTVLPAFTGGGFIAWFVFRQDKSATVPSTAFAQDAGKNDLRISSNLDNSGAKEGFVHVNVANDPGPDTGGYADADNQNSGGLITLVVDSTGNVDMYLNGARMTGDTGVIPYATGAFASYNASELGQSAVGTEPAFWAGEWYRILVLRDYVSSTTGLRTICSDDERMAVDGGLMWHYGIQNMLPALHPYRSVPPSKRSETNARYTNAQKLMSPSPIVTVFGALTHKIVAVIASDVTTPAGIGGLGYGLAFNSLGHLYSVGPPIAPTGLGTDPSWASIRMIAHKGEGYSIDPADGAWAVQLGSTASETFSFDRLQLAVDSFDNVFIPFYADGYAGTAPAFLAYDKTGAQILAPDSVPPQGSYAIAVSPLVPDYTGNPTTIDRPETLYLARRRVRPVVLQFLAGNPAVGDCVRFHPVSGSDEQFTFAAVIVADRDVLIGASVFESLANLINAIMGGPGNGTTYLNANLSGSAFYSAATVPTNSLQIILGERVPSTVNTTVSVSGAPSILGPNAVLEATPTVLKYSLITQTPINDTGRDRILLGVSGGDISVFDLGASAITPVGGAGALGSATRYVQSAAMAGNVAFTDGVAYRKFIGRTGIVIPWKSTGYGAIPPHCTIIEPWRGTFFLAGDPDDASNYFLGEQGNQDGWDFYPDVVTEKTATWGVVGAAGTPDDIINAIVPITDGYALLLCDHSVWAITGNPSPGSNGRVELVSKITGGSFGRPWAFGPRGEVYWWGSQGGVWVFAGGSVYSLSDATMQNEFLGLDLSKFYCRMQWNWRYDGLDIFFCPYGGVSDVIRSYFWQRSEGLRPMEPGGFWPDSYTNFDHQPCSLLVLDGDQPQDRRTIFGCRDGYVRTFDELKDTDDATAIDSSVLIGPLTGETQRFNIMASRLQLIIESTQGEVRVEFYTSKTPSDKGDLKRVYRARPGLNNFSARFNAPYIWIRLQSQQRWAMEACLLAVEEGSLKR